MAVRIAEFKKGQISKTKGQEKKHYTQFKKNEKIYLTSMVSITKDIKLSKHAKKKDITINLDEIEEILKTKEFMIIEYNRTNGDERVLLRSNKKFETRVNGKKVMCNLCFVLSFRYKIIVTAYYNSTKDNHSSIDYHRYNKNLKII